MEYKNELHHNCNSFASDQNLSFQIITLSFGLSNEKGFFKP
jgi:hypothetical protein